MKSFTKEKITLAAGCFWCYDTLFNKLRGVEEVIAGYANGNIENPTYEQVCYEDTGFAESVQIEFDTDKMSLETLLDVFWHIHDPTQINRQGNDIGSQYRSAIFYRTEEQKNIAQISKEKIGNMGEYKDPIATKIEPFKNFYKAEPIHQNYYENFPNAGYCQAVITTKYEKFLKRYSELID